MTEPFLSIVIPVYNAGKYVADTLESLFDQTYANYEIIAVNDGSTDDSLAILKKYAEKDERLKVFDKANEGVSATRLFGIRQARGDYIGFVDSDDVVEPDMFSLLISNAVSYDADISHCGYQMVFPSRTDLYYGTGNIIEQNRTKGVSDLLEGKIIEPGVVNKIYRCALFDGLEEKVDPSVKINEDLLMNYFLFKQSSRSIFEDVCKYHYMVRSGSAATARMNVNKLRDPVTVARTIFNDCKTNTDLYSPASRLYSEKLILAATVRLKDPQKELNRIQKDIRKELRAKFRLFIKQQNKKQILKVIFAAFLPSVYGFVHFVYSEINGNSQKYSTE